MEHSWNVTGEELEKIFSKLLAICAGAGVVILNLAGLRSVALRVSVMDLTGSHEYCEPSAR
jgi:hypothetical protein